MELRSDIAAAAARMTSGYDVNREIRQLGAYLREGESVQRLTSGVYGTGTGLLAVTNLRVLLLRDGRSGQASEGFPLERLSTAEWMADGVRGTITVSDSNSIAELREVTAADGEEIVGYVRALLGGNAAPQHGHRWPDQRMSHTAPSIPVVHTQGTPPYGMPTQVGPAQATPPYGMPAQDGPAPGSAMPAQGMPAQGMPAQGMPAQGMPAQAMPAQGMPAQAMPAQGMPAQAMPARGMPAQGMPAHGMPAQHVAPGSTADALARGAVPVTLLSRTGSIPSQQPPVDGPTVATPSSGASGTAPSVPTGGPTAAPATPQGGITSTATTPVTALVSTSGPTTAMPPVGAPPVGAPQAGAPQAGAPSVGGATATTPVVATSTSGASATGGGSAVTNSQPVLIGEVPISQLAAEESGGTPVVTGEPSTEGAPDPTVAVNAVGTTADAGERPEPISWRLPSQKPAGSTTRAESRTAAVRPPTRVEAASRPSGSGPGRSDAGRKKWVWLGAGAAGLIALAAIGSAKLISPQQQPGAVPVSPTPAVVDSATGPVVTVARVVDGDTIEVTGQEVNGPVEVLGIVAPRADRNQCGAATSKAYAVRMLNNAQVTLVTDPSQPATNRAGHKQAFVKLANGSDYSVMAAGAGMARYYASPQPVMSADEIKAAEAAAQSKREGVWGPPCNAKPTASAEISGAGNATNSGTGSPARAANETGNQPG